MEAAMNHPSQGETPQAVQVVNRSGRSSVVLVCEHASHYIPSEYQSLGLSEAALTSHVAWDPGAMGVARHLAEKLDAALVAGAVSRLVYDCNRPPEAPDAMPAKSEVFEIPGNADLSAEDRAGRTAAIYAPFRTALAATLAARSHPVLVTIHSFTPVYHGQNRAVEIGVLHDSDSRLADAMLETAPNHTTALVERNAPYGPQHGVTHTLKEHALAAGHANVMLEIRNDLIRNAAQQIAMAEMIASWVAASFEKLDLEGEVTCKP